MQWRWRWCFSRSLNLITFLFHFFPCHQSRKNETGLNYRMNHGIILYYIAKQSWANIRRHKAQHLYCNWATATNCPSSDWLSVHCICLAWKTANLKLNILYRRFNLYLEIYPASSINHILMFSFQSVFQSFAFLRILARNWLEAATVQTSLSQKPTSKFLLSTAH